MMVEEFGSPQESSTTQIIEYALGTLGPRAEGPELPIMPLEIEKEEGTSVDVAGEVSTDRGLEVGGLRGGRGG